MHALPVQAVYSACTPAATASSHSVTPLARSLPPPSLLASPVLYSLLVHESCTISYSYSVPRGSPSLLVSSRPTGGAGLDFRAGRALTRGELGTASESTPGARLTLIGLRLIMTMHTETRAEDGDHRDRSASNAASKSDGKTVSGLLLSLSLSFLLSHPPLSQSPLAVRSLYDYVVCQRSAGLCLL